MEPFDVLLDSYLEREDAIVVDRLTVHLESQDDGDVELRVSAGHVSAEVLTPVVDRMTNPRHAPVFEQELDDGTRRNQRLIFSDTAIQAINRTKQLRSMGPEATPLLVDATGDASVFDTALFDLSAYSDRVIGFGRPVYRVSRSMAEDDPTGGRRFELSQTSGEGFDGEEPLPVPLTTEEQEALCASLQEASERGLPYVRFNDGWVRVPNPTQLGELEESIQQSDRRGTLVVAENLDEQQYAIDSGDGEWADAPERPPGLHDDFSLLPHQVSGLKWLAGHAGFGEFRFGPRNARR